MVARVGFMVADHVLMQECLMCYQLGLRIVKHEFNEQSPAFLYFDFWFNHILERDNELISKEMAALADKLASKFGD